MSEQIEFAVIGGTGLTEIEGLEIIHREVVHTPFGEPSGQITHGLIAGKRIAFLARHGYTHSIPPHKVNYRANLWALHHIGVQRIVAVAAVGGITARMGPQTLVIPDQIIDYTYGRAHTFFEEGLNSVTHIDFSYPYCPQLRRALLKAGKTLVWRWSMVAPMPRRKGRAWKRRRRSVVWKRMVAIWSA